MTSPELGREEFCYLTTVGRLTGRPHTIEIWFALDGAAVYMLSGSGRDASDRPRADWVQNIQRGPDVTLRIAGKIFRGKGRIVAGQREEARARALLVEKYRSSEDDLTEWGRTAIPVAIDLT